MERKGDCRCLFDHNLVIKRKVGSLECFIAEHRALVRLVQLNGIHRILLPKRAVNQYMSLQHVNSKQETSEKEWKSIRAENFFES